MKTLTKTGVIAYLVAVFLAGGIAGAFAGYSAAHRRPIHPPQQGDMTTHMLEFAKERLQLTDEQVKQVRPIIAATAVEFQTVSCGMAERINDIVKKANERIAPFLTAKQKQLLEDLNREREERFAAFMKQGHSGQ